PIARIGYRKEDSSILDGHCLGSKPSNRNCPLGYQSFLESLIASPTKRYSHARQSSRFRHTGLNPERRRDPQTAHMGFLPADPNRTFLPRCASTSCANCYTLSRASFLRDRLWSRLLRILWIDRRVARPNTYCR